MAATISPAEEAQLQQTIEMFEVITQSQPQDYQSLEILKEAYFKLGRPKDVVGTSKRIAEAYVQLGQLSSAIMEYETILQRFPDDPDVKKALADIESRANSFSAPPLSGENSFVNAAKVDGTKSARGADGKPGSEEADDGRQVMQKIFVDSKLIAATDFNTWWPDPNSVAPGDTAEPFIQTISEKSGVPVEKSLRLLLEKSRLGYLPLDKYDIDVEFSRTFSKDACRRWCVLPFDRLSKSVMVATTNPFNKAAAAELQAATPSRLLWYIAPPADLVKTLKKVFR